MGNHHTADLLSFLADALNEAADDLRDGDERRAAERLRIVYGALRAAEPAQDWETLGLVLELQLARLGPPAEADDAWPYHEHLDDLPDMEEDMPSLNPPFLFRGHASRRAKTHAKLEPTRRETSPCSEEQKGASVAALTPS